jgi:drug/metabolite transporter (DMT)-like permease
LIDGVRAIAVGSRADQSNLTPAETLAAPTAAVGATHGPARAHRNAILLMLAATFLWSIAGVFTRQLEHARSWEVTFWRSVFAFLFMLGALVWQHRADGARGAWRAVHGSGRAGLLSGLMWATMFTCFMLALTRTTTANTLIVNSLSPLFAALLAWFVLRQPIAARTWTAIAIAIAGMAWMFHAGLAADEGALSGTLIAFAVPIASAINVVTLKRVGHEVDLVPAVLIGALGSALVALPAALPFAASARDIAILALLGFFQLGLPCMLMVRASRHLAAPELALLTLLEVIEGPLWSWLFAGEAIAPSTLSGGGVVLAALVLNELARGSGQPRARITATP